MKTLFIGLGALLLCAACGGGKGSGKTDGALLAADSVMVADTMAAVSSLPDNLDGTFDDFVYTYASDKHFQLSRTCFPLPCTENGERIEIPRSEWEHDALYANQEFYNMLFDTEADMDYEKNVDVDSVYVAWLFLDKQRTRRYHFGRVRGHWMLQNIEEASLKGTPNEDFLRFFYEFCNDSTFQRAHIKSPLRFVTTDPEDDFRVMEAFISVDQWFAFRPPLMQGTLTNVHYGQMELSDSKTKIMEIKGFGNGFNCVLYFERRKGLWHLVRFEDLGD